MKRVLVVEDEASIREMVALNLKMAGWEVVEAPSAERALELMHHGEECDAALLDIMLPGMDGLSLCETIRRENNEIGIIIVSAKGQESDKIRGLSIGADDYITKPFSVSELVARLEALTRRIKRGGAGAAHQRPLCAGRKEPHAVQKRHGHRPDPGGVPDHGAVLPQPRHSAGTGKDLGRRMGQELFRRCEDRGCEHPPPAHEDRRRTQQPPAHFNRVGVWIPVECVSERMAPSQREP